MAVTALPISAIRIGQLHQRDRDREPVVAGSGKPLLKPVAKCSSGEVADMFGADVLAPRRQSYPRACDGGSAS